MNILVSILWQVFPLGAEEKKNSTPLFCGLNDHFQDDKMLLLLCWSTFRAHGRAAEWELMRDSELSSKSAIFMFLSFYSQWA